MNLTQAKEILTQHSQEHILSFWNELDDKQKSELLSQIENIDFDLLDRLYSMALTSSDKKLQDISPIKAIKKGDIANVDYMTGVGENCIKEGKLAFVTMAGGQGTRLGFNGPKGAYILDTKLNKSLFELLCDTLKKARQKYLVTIPWYIMTSRENNKQTIEFFEKNNFFDYGRENVFFFVQKEMPMLLENGKCILETVGKIKEASDGHGGVFKALGASGAIDDMKRRGVKWVFIGGVDNCLLKMVDPLFIGLCEDKGYMLASKTITKRSPEEKVGVFCKNKGRPYVIEYSEISDDMANLRDENGELVYGQSHILCNMFNIELLDKMISSPLPYHVAHKKSNYIDERGTECVPDKPNAYKFESFIFDAFSLAEDILLLETKREEEFAPVKNSDGEDSPETALKLLNEYRKVIEENNV